MDTCVIFGAAVQGEGTDHPLQDPRRGESGRRDKDGPGGTYRPGPGEAAVLLSQGTELGRCDFCPEVRPRQPGDKYITGQQQICA